MRQRRITSVVILSAAWLASCSLAPTYHTPHMDLPEAYKEAPGPWHPLNTKASAKDRGPWWKAYSDPDLDALEDKVTESNQNLKAAVARYDEARALAGQARAGFFPTITARADGERERTSRTVIEEIPYGAPFNDFLAGVDVSYELDVWGKVRNAVKASENRASATAADLATMDLSLHAELAMDYFALRGDDALQQVLDETVSAYEKALKLTEARHEGGIAPEVDVDQAKTQLQTAKTMAADNHLNRTQLEHAIAVLIGQMPSGFAVAVKSAATDIPPTAVGLPSALLEQRPDIAAAGLRVEAANADIGVARAAYFPDFTLSGDIGFESALLPKLLSKPSLYWAFGPSLAAPIFEGGKIDALNAQARAAYNESVANYRQTVLNGFQQVEDSLVALHQLDQEIASQSAAVIAANRALAQAKDRYQGGIATYLDVVVAENMALQSQLSLLNISTRRLLASILLIKALGGGWHADTHASAASSSSH